MAGKDVSSIKTEQSARFIEAARQVGADEDEAAFKAKLAQIARVKTEDAEPAKKKVNQPE